MKHFLVVYDRRRGRVVRLQDYNVADQALTARFEAEREYSDQPDIEVVVLGAESRQALAHTHSRYFKDVRELAEAALRKVAPA
jgi:hypothetical protein